MSDDLLQRLTPAERRVATMLAQGMTQRAIAQALGRGERCIFVQAHSAAKRAGCASPFELAVRVAATWELKRRRDR